VSQCVGTPAASPNSLRRALSPTFPAGEMVFFIPWRVVAEESGAAHFGLGGAMLPSNSPVFGIFPSCCCGILPFGDVAAAHSERHNHVMGRERGGQSSPDLFSADAVSPPRSRPPAEKPMAESAPQRHVLPKNLPNAVKHLNRDSPDDRRAGVHIGAFPAFQQDRREVWTATGTSGRPNDGRASNLAIFAGIWTHGSRRLLLNP
jgi:hypothetical protein